MHEVSLIRTIFSTLEAEFSPEECALISEIELKVGLLSNVEPQLMQNAFAAVQESSGRFPGVSLKIEVVPIAVYCHACDLESIVKQYRFICSNFHTPTNTVIRGTELLIHRVHIHDPAPSA